MSILSEVFGGGGDPAQAANKYLSQIPGVGHKAYDPYIQQGQESGANVHGQYEDLMKDPQGFINKIMQGYQPSEGYQFQKDQLGRSMSSTAAAGGIAGTPQDQMNQGQRIQQLLSGDQQQYLSNILGAYNTGLNGEQGEANQGYNATGALADIEGNALNQQGGLAFQGAQQKTSNRNQMIQTLIKALTSAAGAGNIFNSNSSMPMSGTHNAPWSNPG